MKLALFLATSIASAAFAGTVNSPYQVGIWQGFRSAAISYTFDDGFPNQFAVAVPMFNAKGFKLTLFTVSGWVGSWSSVQSAAVSGHEIASHTVWHPDFGSLSASEQTSECQDSQAAINANVPGQDCVTLAYPYCTVGDESIVAQYYIGARGCSHEIVPSTPPDFLNISSFVCGTGAAVPTTEEFNRLANNAASSGGWIVYLIHGLDNDGGYCPLPSSELQGSVNYMDANRSTFWVETFGNVVRYIRERNDVSVEELGSTSTTLAVSVTHGLNNSVYNIPVTIRRPLPSGWSSATAAQGGGDLDAQIVTVNGTQYVMFDAVPNGGNVTITSVGDPFAGATFYQDYNYGGAAGQSLDVGSYTMGQLADKGVGNDWASSVRVPIGHTVTMYADDNFGGTSWTLTADQSEFGSIGANDQVSSVVVQSGLNGTYKLIARHSGKAMDAFGAQTANGTEIIQWSYGGGANQKWNVTDTGGGNYKIIGVQSGKSLDIYAGATANGTKVELWDFWGGPMQLFKFTTTDGGYYWIAPNCATGSCLDVSGISTADGAVVHLWQWLGGNNQQWAPQAP